MAELSSEKRKELIAATKEAAAAFLEDLEYLRKTTSNNAPAKAEIRRLSVILRRLLVERVLVAISCPRLGRVTLQGPDLRRAYKAGQKVPFTFFGTGGGRVLGGFNCSVWLYNFKVPRPPERVVLPNAMPPKTLIEMRLDTFLSQRVICYLGTWVTRSDVITSVANVASGVHSGTAREPAHVTLAKVRGAISYSVREGGIHADFFPKGIGVDNDEFRYAPDSMDPVLIELIAAATFFVGSPFVSELEASVRKELVDDS